MRKASIKITENNYNALNAMTENERYSFVNRILPDWVSFGYGYYGIASDPYKENEKYYIDIYTGGSCD